MADAKSGFQADSLIKTLEDAYKNAPNLPANIREVLVKIVPWLALIFGILGVLAGLGALGLSPVGMLGGVENGAVLLLSGVFTIVSSVLMLMAYPKVNKRLYAGWKLLFWAEVVSFVGSLLTFTLGSIVSALIGVVIGLYLLFQIKSYYK